MPWKCLTCDTLHADSANSCRTCKKPAPTIDRFESDTQILSLGSSIHLEWKVSEAAEIWIDDERVEKTGRWKLNPINSEQYVLCAKNNIKENRAIVKVELPKPVIKYFTVAEEEIRLGLPTILYWEVENADKVLINRGVGEVSGQTFFGSLF